ncbi:MAG: patatin-like phospholipase family protein [Pseudomonadales bacterium]
MKVSRFFLCSLVCFGCCAATTSYGVEPAPKIGLVLSGGGARGLAHIGVIRALEEQNIKIDAIAGTSMGAVIGALYASGRSVDEIERIALAMDWSATLDDTPPRSRMSFRRKRDDRLNVVRGQAALEQGIFKLPKGVVQGQTLQVALQEQFLPVGDIAHFDQLDIPFRAVASDLVTGAAHVFSDGLLATAVRASMSIPGIFSPVEIDGKMLVDGGIANNLPVDVVKAMGVDYVIAVDITTPLYSAKEMDSVIPIIEQLTTLLTFNRAREQYALISNDDLLVTPDVSDIHSSAFELSELAIKRGYDAIIAHRKHLAVYAGSGTVNSEDDKKFTLPIIDSIEVRNDSKFSNHLILSRISQVIGEPLDERQLRVDIDSIYGYGYFESVQYRLQQKDQHLTLVITAQEKSLGKDLLGLSMDLFTDTRADSSFNLGLTFRKSGLTQKGAEFFAAGQVGQDPGVEAELYLPLDFRQRFYAEPYASYKEQTQNEVETGQVTSRIRIDQLVYGLFMGVEISNKAILGLGHERRSGHIDTFVGPTMPRLAFENALHYGKIEFDTMDNLEFPSSGTLLQLRYDFVNPDDSLARYEIFNADLAHAFAIGRHAFVFDGRYVRSTGTVERHLQPALGGIKNLSGLPRQGLTDNNLAYLSLTYLNRLNDPRLLPLELPVYIGFAIESGNTWTDASDIRFDDMIIGALLMLGVDTPLGPVYFGYGRAETDVNRFYIRLGHLLQ